MSSLDELLQIDEALKDRIRKIYKTAEEDIHENIAALRIWLKKTPHLPEEKTDERFERYLLQYRMSMENTKQALERYYTAKSYVAEFFGKLTPNSVAYLSAKSYTCVVAMPQLTEELSRVTIHKLTNVESDCFDPMEAFIVMAMIRDLRANKDYHYSDIVIFDMSGYTLKHILKFTPGVIRRLRYIIAKAFNYKITSIHLINVPHYTDKIMPVFRSIVGSKVYHKVHLHNSLETLYEYVPKANLPADFGGEGATLLQLYGKWCTELEKFTDFFEDQLVTKSDESLRIGRCHEFEIFGTGSEGSFKQLHAAY